MLDCEADPGRGRCGSVCVADRLPMRWTGGPMRRRCSPRSIRPRFANGRAYAQLVDPQSGVSRGEAILRGERDTGAGVPLPAAIRVAHRQRRSASRSGSRMPDAGSPGPTAGRARAHGVVRVINERHAREEQLAYLAQFDSLTGEMNRARLHGGARRHLEEAVRLRSSCGFLLVAIDDLGRINEAYGFDVADEVIAAGRQAHARADARQGPSRARVRQQVRHHPEQLHAG